MGFKKIFCFLLCILCIGMISGCRNTSYDVKLSGSHFEYKEDTFDVCQVISKIGNNKVSKYQRKEGKIETLDYNVTCPILKIKELGKQEVEISIDGISAFLNFDITDKTPPEISVQKEKYEVEEGNEYFDIKKLITVKDLYDPNPVVGYSGEIAIDVPGTYDVLVTASDSQKNKAEKSIKVVVNEKEVQIVEKEVVVPGGTSPVQPNTNESPPVVTQPNESNGATPNTSQPIISSLPPNTWLFSDGYDLISGFKACQDYRGGNTGSCSPLGVENDPYGYQYNP